MESKENKEEEIESDITREETVEKEEPKKKLKYYQEIGKMGGEKRKEELGHEGYVELGKKGGKAVKKLHGNETLEEVRKHHEKGEA